MIPDPQFPRQGGTWRVSPWRACPIPTHAHAKPLRRMPPYPPETGEWGCSAFTAKYRTMGRPNNSARGVVAREQHVNMNARSVDHNNTYRVVNI
jgi:hypothetical protein